MNIAMKQRSTPYWLHLPAILFFIIGFFVIQSQHAWKRNQVFRWDAFGYHSYLPSLILYHDWKQVRFLDTIVKTYQPAGNKTNRFGFHSCSATKNLCNQYTMGVAIMHLPAFLIAHAYTRVASSYPADGYSFHYQKANMYMNLLYAAAGILLLSFFLSHFVSITISVISCLLIAFGTNLLYYSYCFSGLSHPCLFFLYAAILYLTDLWYRKVSFKNSFLLALCIGLCILIRPIDVLVVLIPILWYHPSKLNYWREHRKTIICILVGSAWVCLPQLLYWKSVSGSWLYYSYDATVDYFVWNRLRIVQGLISYQNGWFVYTPLALIGVVAGACMDGHRMLFTYRRLLFLFLIPYCFLVFSWHNWFYGWSFGCRALVQTLPLLALPLAWYLQWVSKKSNLYRAMISALLAGIVFLNLFQSWQFEKGILVGSLMNEKYYWRVFLATTKDPALDRLLYLQQQMESEFGW